MWPKSLNILKKGSKKVFVGLSGGVDSAVSAALLKQQGYDVTGVFIKVWQPFDEVTQKFIGPCAWREERRDAMKVAIALDIPFLFFDFEKEYKKGVVDNMLSEYKAGRTPNPDVLCNREIKFGAFWKKAKELGADYIATGHYARISGSNGIPSPALGQKGKVAVDDIPFGLYEGVDKEKDQSYFLWTLTQNDLSHTLFPVGDMKKENVRKLARKFNLPVAEKKDSQGICFIGDIRMEDFLSHFIKTKRGDVLNLKGEVIGIHHGAQLFTIGERHGFEISKKGPESGPFYVIAKDVKANTITVSDKEPEIIAMSPKKITLKNINWINEPVGPRIFARIRYRGEKIPVTLSLEGKELAVGFDKPVRGLSLGQSIVFYDSIETNPALSEKCLGGGVMNKIIS